MHEKNVLLYKSLSGALSKLEEACSKAAMKEMQVSK
jgi:hypothetical protein